MKVFELKDEENRLYAFEINNLLVSRKRIVKILQKLPGTEIIKRPKLFSIQNQDEFCEFTFKGKLFVVEEPFGDNSRYWLGPKPVEYHPETKILVEHFRKN